jgi:uncharacterized membrane protein
MHRSDAASLFGRSKYSLSRAAVRTSGRVPRAGAGWLALAALAFGCGLVPDAQIEPIDALVTSEAGGAARIAVRLAHRPLDAVLVEAQVGDASEARATAALRFDRDNWRTPQTITISGVDDGERDGDVQYDVTFVARSQRAGDHAFALETLRFVNLDDDGASFASLGDLAGGDSATYVTDISAAGDVVVGYSRSDAGDEAIRWTPESGLTALGGPGSRALAVSPNGLLITGSIDYVDSQRTRAGVLWRQGAPYELLFADPGPFGMPPQHLVIEGTVVLDDGRVFANCYQYGGYRDSIGCRVDGPGMVEWANTASRIFAADASGNNAGTRHAERHAPFSSVAILHGNPLPYPPGSEGCVGGHHCEAAAQAYSADGSVAIGTSRVPLPSAEPPLGELVLWETAFVYAAGEGVVRLPDLPGGEQASGAFDISDDGSLIGGFGTDARGKQAVLWIDGTPHLLVELLHAQGLGVPDGYVLREVTAMSANGLTLAGNADNERGEPTGFRVVLPAL